MTQVPKRAPAEESIACARRILSVRKPFFGRAAGLLTKLLERGMSVHTLAAALMITPRQLEAYRLGQSLMPLDRQLCLALFVMETRPHLAKECRALRAQVAAASAFQRLQVT